jgi:hypothetical protein
MTLSINGTQHKGLFETLSINDTQYDGLIRDTQHQ